MTGPRTFGNNLTTNLAYHILMIIVDPHATLPEGVVICKQSAPPPPEIPASDSVSCPAPAAKNLIPYHSTHSSPPSRQDQIASYNGAMHAEEHIATTVYLAEAVLNGAARQRFIFAKLNLETIPWNEYRLELQGESLPLSIMLNVKRSGI